MDLWTHHFTWWLILPSVWLCMKLFRLDLTFSSKFVVWWSSVAFLPPCPLVKLTLSSILDLEKLSQTKLHTFKGPVVQQMFHTFHIFDTSFKVERVARLNVEIWAHETTRFPQVGNLPPIALVTALRGQGTSSVTLMPLKTSMMFARLGMLSVSFLKLDPVKT